MDDIRPDVRGDDRRSMTYVELATARGISAKSAERLVRRRRWSKQAGNDGTVRVLVPVDETQPSSARNPGHQSRRPGGHQAGQPDGHPPADILPAIREAVREVIRPLSEKIEAANRRADAERDRADRERERADQAEQRLAAL